MQNQLNRGTGGLRFVEATKEAGPALALSEVSRGVAFGDVDEDGDVDLLISNNNGPARLLRNEVGAAKPWLGLRLTSGTPPRDAFGARLAVDREGAVTLWGRIGTDRSFASANDPRALFGLGDGDAVTGVRVFWPDGGAERFPAGCTRCYRVLHRGEGAPLAGSGP
jgi:hypothetical protein